MRFALFQRLVVILLILCDGFFFAPLSAEPETMHHIKEVELKGLRFTDPTWLFSYLPLNCPCDLSEAQLLALRSKLLTTQVFQSVEFGRQPLLGTDEKLVIDLIEKWTVIPVIRGAIGGGTPLLVMGIYDSHLLGRLWTVGAEARRYGNAPAGGVAWFRAPRWKEGRHYLNFEVWRDNRIRSVFNVKDKEIASVYGSALSLVGDYLLPIAGSESGWQMGLRYQYRDQQKLEWYERPAAPSLLYNFETQRTHSGLLRLIYDDVEVSQLNLNGFRALMNFGPVFSQNKTRNLFEQESFLYLLWADNWNLSLHEWIGITSDRDYQSLFFLGGFDSIRGIPDGVLFGNKAVYSNIELRKLFYQSRFAWLQAATYFDYGAAAFASEDWGEKGRSSVGVGLRLAIPQVHRLMFRLDYAWSLDRAGTSSISAGLNQFIDPYRPL
jgi:hypothetical protein